MKQKKKKKKRKKKPILRYFTGDGHLLDSVSNLLLSKLKAKQTHIFSSWIAVEWYRLIWWLLETIKQNSLLSTFLFVAKQFQDIVTYSANVLLAGFNMSKSYPHTHTHTHTYTIFITHYAETPHKPLTDCLWNDWQVQVISTQHFLRQTNKQTNK